MSFAQAYHTSCREGLAGFSGFQMNAATPALTREQLSSLSAAHARYDPPRDMPYEPTKEEMRRFPVALRASVVDGVGPVVSRTEYVGREYRRFDGQPDEGRYGNYFCHLLVGDDGASAFDGLLGIELWDAPHWTTDESSQRTLPELDHLTPGPLNVDAVLDEVARAPAGVMEGLITGAQAALDGGPPLIIVDVDPNRAPVWIAFVNYCLPPDLSAQLTFSTFEGRPRDIFDLNVIVTTPACDPGAGGSPSRVDVTQATTPSDVPLYARVIRAIVTDGGDALSRAVRPVTGRDRHERGASLAIYAERADLIADDDVPVTLRCLRDMGARGDIERAAETVAKLATSEAADRAAVCDWFELHLSARRSAVDGARDLAGATLARLVPVLDALPADARAASGDLRAVPSVSGLGAWLRALEGAADPPMRARLVRDATRLSLLSHNVPVDQRVAAVIADDLGTAEMDAAVDDIAGTAGLSHIITTLAVTLAEQAPTSPRARAGLVPLARYPAAQRTLQDRAAEVGTFDAHMTWQRVRVALDPACRRDAARALIPLIADDGARAQLRELWGPEGPRTQNDLFELVNAYVEAGRPIPEADKERAFQGLMSDPLPTKMPPRDHIGWTLAKLPLEERRRPELYAWAAYTTRPPDRPLADWCDRAAKALAADERTVPNDRWVELITIVAKTLVEHRRDFEFPVAISKFESLPDSDEELCVRMGHVMQEALRRAKDPLMSAAQEFEHWQRQPRLRLTELVLPTAFERLSQRDVEDIWEILQTRSATRADEWERWTRRHPRRSTRDKVGRVFGRGTGRKKGGGV